jgi:ketosteroid isomerase-like protein
VIHSHKEKEVAMAGELKRAASPEDITRLFVERANAKDVDGLVALYEPEAVLAFPPGQMTVGRDGIRAVYEQMLARDLTFEQEKPPPTLYFGEDLALTATPASDEAGARAQVVRRQPDETWLRILDRPDFRG